MIAEQLAGKRIAITGSTGFVGTALVERLLRSVPGLHAGAARSSQQAPRRHRAGPPRDLQEQRVRPPEGRTGAHGPRPSTRWSPAACVAIGGDVSTDGLGLNDVDRADVRQLRHRHPLGRRRGVRQPARHGRRDQPAGPDAHRRDAARARRHAAPRDRQHLLRRRQPARQRTGGSSSATGRWDIGLNWRKEVAASRRLRGDSRPPAATPTSLRTSASEARKELGAAGAPALAAKTESLRERVGEGAAGRGRPRSRRQRRLARRLRLHQGARRAGAHRDEGQRAGHHRAAAASSSPRWPSRSPAGSAASAWPSRSSSATPAGC